VKVGAIVLHYRFWPGVRSTLEAVQNQTRPPDSLLVVDNHSGDRSISRLRQGFPNVEVIVAPTNRGYGAGMNLGMETLLSRGMDAILLLTHECRLDPDALEALVTRLEDEPKAGAVGPLLGYLSNPSLVYSAGGVIHRRRWRQRHVNVPKLVAQWAGKPPQPVDWLDGAALLLRSAAIRASGRFDEDYFLYFEETEYLLTLKRMGWLVECIPAARAWQEPSSKPTYLWLRNRMRFLARTGPKPALLLELARVVRDVVRTWVRPPSEPARSENRDRVRALLHFLAGRWGAPPWIADHDARARSRPSLKRGEEAGHRIGASVERAGEAGPGSDDSR
jgi:GT2 family glycosyltransferase